MLKILQKNKKKKDTFKALTSYFFILLLIGVGVFIYHRDYYSRVMVEKVYNVFPSSEPVREGVAFKRVDQFVESETGNKQNFLAITPGSFYEGVFLVKNNYLSAQNVGLVTFGVLNSSSPDSLGFESEADQSVFMKSGEWKLLKYRIVVPVDFPMGDYKGTVAAKVDRSIKYNENTKIVLAVGEEFNIRVVDSLENDFFVDYLVDPDLSTHELAMSYVFSSLKKFLGYGFGLLALLFLYKGLKK